MKRVFVSGAGGFIGLHLVEKLLRECFEVVALTRKPFPLTHPALNVVVGDVLDIPQLHNVESFDIAYHLAAYTDLRSFQHHKALAWKTNVDGTRNFVEHLASHAKKIVYVSTFGVYGNPSHVPTPELRTPHPLEDYAESKLVGETIVTDLCREYGLSSVIARPYSCYGERQRSDAFIPTIIHQLLTSSVLRLGNLEPTRDFVYVGDVVEALCCLAAPSSQGIYNIGTGHETPLRDVVSLLITLSGKNASVVSDPTLVKPSSFEVRRSCADITRLLALGWTPKTLLKQGLEKTYSYYAHKHLSRDSTPSQTPF